MQLPVGFRALCLYFRVCSSGLYVFQLQDVAMRNLRIACLVGHHQEITVSVVQLDFRLYEVKGIQGKVCLEEPLQVMLAQDAVAHRRVLLVCLGNAGD